MPTKKPRNPDHVRRRHTPQPDNEAITEHLQDLLSPAIYAQSGYDRSLGLRERILNLTLMVAAVLTLIWRQVPSVQELGRYARATGVALGKSGKSIATSIVPKVSVAFQLPCLSVFCMTYYRCYKSVGTLVNNDHYQQQ